MSTASRRLHFCKMHGAGNDFVIVDGRQLPALDPALVRVLADRHRGVGCDQLISIERASRADAVAAYRIWNSDGSVARQCGNGARCVAAWLQREDARLGPHIRLESPSGLIEVQALGDGRYRLDLGRPSFAHARIPFLPSSATVAIDALRFRLDLDGETVIFAPCGMGNPHAVIEVDDLATAPVERLAQRLQARPEFPGGVNVGFAQVRAPDAIDLRVYERGVGETLACGSGACAAAAVLIRSGRISRSPAVHLPGGRLDIDWLDDSAPIHMAGPTTFVFSGEWIA